MRDQEQISEHKVRLYEAFRVGGGWMTANEAAAAANVASRTSRGHCREMSERGVLEVVKLFGGYRYRVVGQPKGEGASYAAELAAAKRILDRLG